MAALGRDGGAATGVSASSNGLSNGFPTPALDEDEEGAEGDAAENEVLNLGRERVGAAASEEGEEEETTEPEN